MLIKYFDFKQSIEVPFLEMEILFLLFAAPAILFAGISKGGFGSGAAFAAAPFLATIIEPKIAIGLMLPLLMLMDVTGLYFYWKKWLKSVAIVLILGGIPGVALGALFFSYANPYMLKLMIGFIAILFIVHRLTAKNGFLKFSNKLLCGKAGYFWAILSGFTSCISHAGGPPTAIYLLSKNISKTEYQATTVIVFWVINLVKLIPFLFFDLINLDTLKLSIWLAPVALFGTWIGVRAHYLIPEKIFYLVINFLLFITGLKLLYDAYIGLFAF